MRFTLLLLCAACMGAPDSSPWCSLGLGAPTETSTPTPTWNAAAEAIVQRKCSGCHAPGGLAPFELKSFSDVTSRKELVRQAVATRRMPPWQAARCCNTYYDDRSLDDAEYSTLLRFLDEGAPEGDPRQQALTTSPQQSLLSRVDVSVTMPEEYVPNPPTGTDDNRCFVLDWPVDREAFVTGMVPRPGTRREVHHILLGAVPPELVAEVTKLDAVDALPGFDCNGGLGRLQGVQVLGGSVQGGDFPRGLGTKVVKGSKLLLNIHYSTLGLTTVLPDRTSVDFKLDDTARDSASIPIANPSWLVGEAMKVSAGDPDAVFFYKYQPTLLTGGKKVLLQGVTPHMHTFGSRIAVRILRANGGSECLLEIPKWRFGWEQPFWLQNEVEFAPGDELYIECHFDNSESNQPLGQAPRDFGWGGNGQDMCAAFVSYVKVP